MLKFMFLGEAELVRCWIKAMAWVQETEDGWRRTKENIWLSASQGKKERKENKTQKL